MLLTRTFVTSSRKKPKRLSHAGIETTIFRIGIWSVNPSIEHSCSLLRKTTQAWLLQLCLLSLTGCGEIDGPRQLGASTFHTLVEKHGVFSTTLMVGHDTLLVTVSSQLMLLHLSKSKTGDTRLLTASHQELSDLSRATTPDPVSISNIFSQRKLLLPSNI